MVANIEQIKSAGRAEKDAVIITELPFQTNKAGLIERIADMVNEKKLEGFSPARRVTKHAPGTPECSARSECSWVRLRLRAVPQGRGR